jgi:putative chitinase
MATVLRSEIMTNITGRTIDTDYIDNLNTYMPQYNINTLPRIQFFIAIACGETGGFSGALSENMNYSSVDRIKKVFGAERFQNENIEIYVNKAESLANKVYGGRNGNVNAGDGYKFRGGGIFQLTFKDNYIAFAKSISDVGENNVEWLVTKTIGKEEFYIREIEGAVRSACHYAQNRGVLTEADKNTPQSFIAACRKVGKDADGDNYAKKRHYWEKCKTYIGGNGIVGSVEYIQSNTSLKVLTTNDYNIFLAAKEKLQF